jgi:hypothetical protein
MRELDVSMYPKERLIVQQLRDFIEENENSVAIVMGMRRVGKTIALLQLAKYYPNSLYINLRDEERIVDGIQETIYDNNKIDLLLLDEITHLKHFDIECEMLYNLTAGKGRKPFKVIMSGSSSYHLLNLKIGQLGARSKLFRLNPISFTEYLHFTGKTTTCYDYDEVQNSDFADYLLLKDLEPGLQIVFNSSYFEDWYTDVSVSNDNAALSKSQVCIEPADIQNIANLLAYDLVGHRDFSETLDPKVGGQEIHSLYNLGKGVKYSKVDFSDTVVAISKAKIIGLDLEEIKRILQFMLMSGVALLEYALDENEQMTSYVDVLRTIKRARSLADLSASLATVKIGMVTPLVYSRLGKDIFKRLGPFGIDVEDLCKGELLGKMLEIYVRGSLSVYNYSPVLFSCKLRNEALGEVDVFCKSIPLLCELTVSEKKLEEINVTSYYKSKVCLRVCTTKRKHKFDGGYYRIPYSRFCCMVDTGDFMNLKKTVIMIT